MLKSTRSERIHRLRNVAKVRKEDAYEEVLALASCYPDRMRIFIPDVPIRKLKPGINQESYTTPIDTADITKTSNESNLERSIRRTTKSILDYSLCNEFTLFATFTFATERDDMLRCRDRLKYWIKNEQARKGKFGYVIVPEFHKDNVSLHFHALLINYRGELKPSQKNNGELVQKHGKQVYELPSYTHGFTLVETIGDTVEDRQQASYYLQKYITKDMPLFARKHRYWASHGLARPKIVYNPEEWYKHVPPDYESKNDYGRFMEFKYGSNPLADMFIEAQC